MQTVANAADNLEGILLDTGWEVVERITKSDTATGSFFSVCYIVKKNGERCFLKAFDFTKFFKVSGASRVVDVMADMLNAFRYERDLSELCQNSHVTKVAFVKGSGVQTVDGYTIPSVPYLIFDMADGDVRNRLALSDKLDFTWKLYSLHSIATGLKQLHSIGVSHQDLKPSNILVFKEESKIGDLGRSVCDRIDSPLKLLSFTGDLNYAPPEVLYGYVIQDAKLRAYLADCYLLGSMTVYYFSNVSMSALLSHFIPEELSCDRWTGTFEDIQHYLLEAFEKSLNIFYYQLKLSTSEYFAEELKNIVKYLCYPIPEFRGHPKNLSSKGKNYDLERFISKFDLLHRKAKIDFVKKV